MATLYYYCTSSSRIGGKFGKIQPGTEELAAIERLVKIPIYLQKEIVWPILKVSSFLDG